MNETPASSPWSLTSCNPEAGRAVIRQHRGDGEAMGLLCVRGTWDAPAEIDTKSARTPENAFLVSRSRNEGAPRWH